MQRSRSAAVVVPQPGTEIDMRKLMLAAAIVAGGTSASLAQGYYGAPNYSSYGGGYYDYAPGYGGGYGPRYGYRGGYDNYGYGNSARDDQRGGPGPRVGAGSGMGIGSQR
jgi:hypothetical protein